MKHCLRRFSTFSPVSATKSLRQADFGSFTSSVLKWWEVHLPLRTPK